MLSTSIPSGPSALRDIFGHQIKDLQKCCARPRASIGVRKKCPLISRRRGVCSCNAARQGFAVSGV